MRALGFHELRKQGPHGQPVYVARVNAREQRFGDVGRGLVAEAARDEGADRLVGVSVPPPGHE